MLDEGAGFARVFHALSDPCRRLIADWPGQGPALASELTMPLPMSLAAVLRSAEEWMGGRRALIERRLDRLRDYLAATDAAADAAPAEHDPGSSEAARPEIPPEED